MSPTPETIEKMAEACLFWARDRASMGKDVPASIYLMMSVLLSDDQKAREWISHARHFGFKEGGQP